MESVKQRVRGFTLIELLVVIAIIGILASIVLSRITTARDRAHQAKTEASMRSAQTVATYCMDATNNLSSPDITMPVCNEQGNWPETYGFWVYGDAGACVFDGDVSDSTFMFCATDGTKVIQCMEEGCTTS